MAKTQTVLSDLGSVPARLPSSTWQTDGKEVSPSSPSLLQIRQLFKFSCFLPAASIQAAALCVAVTCCACSPFPLPMSCFLCQAQNTREKQKSSAKCWLICQCCAQQGQIGDKNSSWKKTKLLKSSIMESLVGRKCHLAQGKQNLGYRWCSMVDVGSTKSG